MIITGRVQGVGYRAWADREARACGLAGWVRNRPDGSVEAVFAGDPAAVEAMLAACGGGPRHARVAGVAATAIEVDLGAAGFTIRPDG